MAEKQWRLLVLVSLGLLIILFFFIPSQKIPPVKIQEKASSTIPISIPMTSADDVRGI